jgi:hypothetical protein
MLKTHASLDNGISVRESSHGFFIVHSDSPFVDLYLYPDNIWRPVCCQHRRNESGELYDHRGYHDTLDSALALAHASRVPVHLSRAERTRWGRAQFDYEYPAL